MAISLAHAFVVGIADDPKASAAGEVLPSHWNANHTIVGGAGNNLLYNNSGAVTEVTLGANLTFSGGTLSASSGGITINTTAITGGTNKHVLYDNAGTVGEAANFTIDSGNPNIAVLGTGQLEISSVMVMAADPVTNANYFLFGGGNTTPTGSNNYGFGSAQNAAAPALGSIAGGSNNIAIGSGAGQTISTASNNTIVGHIAARNLNSGSNVAVGSGALNTDSTSAGSNVAIGMNALNVFNRAGDQGNIAIGTTAMSAATGGSNNVAIGTTALNNNTTGGNNFALGANCLSTNTTGQNGVAIGNATLQNSNADADIAIGQNTGKDITSGDRNTLIGTNTGRGLTTGRANTVIGAGVIGLGSGLANSIIFADGDGNIRLDYNNTGSNKWVLQTGLDLAYISTAGVLVADSSGNVTSDSNVAAATVAANFSADHRLQVTIGATTYYIAVSTTAW